ncbi:MarR family transcriptional regulator [Gordonia sp. CPCC 205515]|uniref:MarR family winged helix-turn-helix transcriptional regulator n=1 Tax=Gordonia sp. CPCC 205515 TaxID=3140791 RepID=UPI003AF3A83E
MASASQGFDDGVGDIVRGWARSRPDLDTSGLEVFGRLHRSYLLYRAEINAGFECYGINEAGFDVLASLRRAEPHYRRTAGDLAKQTLVTTGGLSLRVNRLEVAGLVVRERDAADARVVYVRLTDDGRRLVDEVADAHFETLSTMLGSVPAGSRRQLVELLHGLERSLQDKFDPSDPSAVTKHVVLHIMPG